MLKNIQRVLVLAMSAVCLMTVGFTLQNIWGGLCFLVGVIGAIFSLTLYQGICDRINWTRSYVVFEVQKGRAIDDGLRICVGEDTISEWVEQANQELEAAKLVVARGEQRLGNM